MRIAIVDDRCYWIQNSRLWEAPFDGESLQKEKSKLVDAHSLSSQEVVLLFEVLDSLNEEE